MSAIVVDGRDHVKIRRKWRKRMGDVIFMAFKILGW